MMCLSSSHSSPTLFRHAMRCNSIRTVFMKQRRHRAAPQRCARPKQRRPRAARCSFEPLTCACTNPAVGPRCHHLIQIANGPAAPPCVFWRRRWRRCRHSGRQAAVGWGQQPIPVTLMLASAGPQQMRCGGRSRWQGGDWGWRGARGGAGAAPAGRLCAQLGGDCSSSKQCSRACRRRASAALPGVAGSQGH